MTGAQYDPLIPAEFRTGADGKNNPYYVDFSDEIDAIYDLADELAGESVSRKVGTMQGAFAAMANAAGADPQVDENAPVEESIRAMSGKLGGSQMAKVWVGFFLGEGLAGDPLSYFTATRMNVLGESTATPINFVEDSTYADDDLAGYYECPAGEVIVLSPLEENHAPNPYFMVSMSSGLVYIGDDGRRAVVVAGPDEVEVENVGIELTRAAIIQIDPWLG